MRHRAAQEGTHVFGIPLEASASQGDTAARVESGGAIGRLHTNAGDDAVAHNELQAAARGLDLHSAVQAGLQQTTDQCLPAPTLVRRLAARELLRTRRLWRGATERRLAHRDVGRDVRRWGDPSLPLSELLEREQRALNGATPAGPAAGKLRVIIGHPAHGVELHRRPVCEETHHLGSSVDVGLGQPPVNQSVRQRHDVRERVFPAVLGPHLRHVRIVGDPHLPAGPRSRPAHQFGFLEDDHARAVVRGGDSGGQAGGARPQDDDVKFSWFHFSAVSSGSAVDVSQPRSRSTLLFLTTAGHVLTRIVSSAAPLVSMSNSHPCGRA